MNFEPVYELDLSRPTCNLALLLRQNVKACPYVGFGRWDGEHWRSWQDYTRLHDEVIATANIDVPLDYLRQAWTNGKVHRANPQYLANLAAEIERRESVPQYKREWRAMEDAPKSGREILVRRDNGCGTDYRVVFWSRNSDQGGYYPWRDVAIPSVAAYPQDYFDAWSEPDQ